MTPEDADTSPRDEYGMSLTEAPRRVKVGLAILPVSAVLIVGSFVFLAPRVLFGEYSSLGAITSSTSFVVFLVGYIVGIATLLLLLPDVVSDRRDK